MHFTNEDNLTIDQESNRAFLDSCFSNLNHEFINLEKKDIFKTVHQYIEENNIKVLTMTSRKHSFLERLFTRHLVETFAFKIDIPFLVMENSNQ